MKILTIIVCTLLTGAGPATQPTTQPSSSNGPKIARELRAKIAELEATVAAMRQQIETLQQQNADLSSKLARHQGTPDERKSIEIAEAMSKKEIIPGMTLEQCKSVIKSGKMVSQEESGVETWTFKRYDPDRYIKEFSVLIDNGRVRSVSVHEYRQ